MISIEVVEQLHRILIDKFGGSHSIRDNAALASALARPFQTFDGKELYPSVLEKTASLIVALLSWPTNPGWPGQVYTHRSVRLSSAVRVG
jgi:death-on-curing protein